MKTKIIFIVLIVLALFAFGCTQVDTEQDNSPEDAEQGENWLVNVCHHFSPATACTKEPMHCTFNYPIADNCGRFVSCSETGELIKQDNYERCVECFGVCSFVDEECPAEPACLEEFPEIRDGNSIFS